MVCFKCGKDTETITHHISYEPEIIVSCCRSCHKIIHNNARKNSLCPYSPKEIYEIYHKSESTRKRNREYAKNFQHGIYFCERMAENVWLYESIYYNSKTQTTHTTSRFVIREKSRPLTEHKLKV